MARGELLNREDSIKEIEQYPDVWDIIIIGGGATGLGAAVDSASRGFKTLLIEQGDFAKGTSSRSTKLIHGGLRYLQQGNISLVMDALKERGILCQNAPHLVQHTPFLVPTYQWWEGPFYGVGVKVYDLLAGSLGLEPSGRISRRATLKAFPNIEPDGLRGGVIYYDGQFDDARLAITLARTFSSLGGIAINYMRVTSLIKKAGFCVGVKVKDDQSGLSYVLRGKVVINATGVFTDRIRAMDDGRSIPLIQASQGIHLVLPKRFQPGKTALLVPHTQDGRVLFMVPWHDRVLVGTTDTPVKRISIEPKAQKKEISFVLQHAAAYLAEPPEGKDILSVFAGLRPLVKEKGDHDTASLSRDHTLVVSASGLISIAGGKWTTYRKMGEDVINQAIEVAGLPKRESITKNLPLHGFIEGVHPSEPLSCYGSESGLIKQLAKENPLYKQVIHRNLPYTRAEVIWAVRKEMARTVEDVLSRRTRALLLDAKASIEAAPLVASMMALELKQDTSWEKAQVEEYRQLSANYVVDPTT